MASCHQFDNQDSWRSKDPISTKSAGFLYAIHDEINDMFYIGSKLFHKKVKVQLKSQKAKKEYTNDSNWKSYYGSSKYLSSAIKKHGKSKFGRYLLSTWGTKRSLINEECYLQHQMNVLTAQKPDGSYWFYNIFIDKCYRFQGHSNEHNRRKLNNV